MEFVAIRVKRIFDVTYCCSWPCKLLFAESLALHLNDSVELSIVLKSFNGKLIKLLYLCLATHACDNLNRQQVENKPKNPHRNNPHNEFR